MTVSNQTPANSSAGNGVTTVFPYTFKILREADMQVIVDGVEKTLTTDYTLSGVGDDAGGNITFGTAPASLSNVVRRRNMQFTRTTDYQYQGDLPASVLNPDMDAPILMLQQVQEQISRTIRGPAGETWTDLPAAASRLDKFLVFDATNGDSELSTVTQTQVASAVAAAYATGSTADAVTYLPEGTGAVSRSVQARLRERASVKDFGAIGDGSTDDTAAIQAAITASYGKTLYFPGGGDYIITSRLSISGSIVLAGDTQTASAIIAVGCSGLIVNSVSSVQIHNLEFAAAVRHTTTPNAYVGIEITGSTGTRPFHHTYRDVFIDGFATGFKSAWLWSSVLDNLKVNACAIGILATNLSANVVVSNCSIAGGGGAVGSRGIQLDGSVDPSEGWMISDTLIDNFEIGIEGVAVTHVYVDNCIIDHNTVNAIFIGHSGGNFGGNWTVRGCYIAMVDAAGGAAISMANTASSSQNRGNIITGNQFIVYSGSVCTYGVYGVGSQAINNVVSGNTFKGFANYDIRLDYGPNVVTSNLCQSAVSGENILAGGSSVIAGNVGSVNFAEFAQYMPLGQNKVTWSYAIPTTGTWTQGDICYKSDAAAGGFIGWSCTASGTPGTWKTFGAISA